MTGSDTRRVPAEGQAAKVAKRTLTNLYNDRPTWLANLHDDLDAAVLAAYGWDKSPTDEEVVARLLDLNAKRPGAGSEGVAEEGADADEADE